MSPSAYSLKGILGSVFAKAITKLALVLVWELIFVGFLDFAEWYPKKIDQQKDSEKEHLSQITNTQTYNYLNTTVYNQYAWCGAMSGELPPGDPDPLNGARTPREEDEDDQTPGQLKAKKWADIRSPVADLPPDSAAYGFGGSW